MNPTILLAVAGGGAAGTLARYVIGAAVQGRAGGGFPVGTLVVNITGSLLLGFLMRLLLDSAVAGPTVRLMLTTGFCGGYTTFSTFTYETARLIEDGEYERAGLYITLSLVLSVAAMFVGLWAARGLLDAGRTS